MSLFIHEGGGRITGLSDFMLNEVSRLLDNLSDLELEMDSIDDLLENLYKYNGGFWDLCASMLRSVKGLVLAELEDQVVVLAELETGRLCLRNLKTRWC